MKFILFLEFSKPLLFCTFSILVSNHIILVSGCYKNFQKSNLYILEQDEMLGYQTTEVNKWVQLMALYNHVDKSLLIGFRFDFVIRLISFLLFIFFDTNINIRKWKDTRLLYLCWLWNLTLSFYIKQSR